MRLVRRPAAKGGEGYLRLASKQSWLRALVFSMIALPALAGAVRSGATPERPVFATLHVPHLEQTPRINDFLSMHPSPAFASTMLKVEGFTQRDPKDGAPISQKTELYLGYTDKNLYVVCICFDSEPEKIRARMSRREDINDDDQIGFVLDTFHDKQHGVFFYLNPLGVQQDGIWSENGQGPDYSFDMLWNSDAKLTGQGYVAWFEIPFKSLRFPPTPEQTWGLFFERDIRRTNEFAFYPHITSNAQGFLSQETEMDGLAKISPGRNLQFIPYASFRSFRQLDDRDPNHALFQDIHAQGRLGLDAKGVIHDALVVDATINPDFAQVESDDPQITVNQRFEVFFPEKRPFFQENAAYFDTPEQLVFTRRIADPEYGVRMTGKLGPWALGWLFADDKSPGGSVPTYDGLTGRKAYYGILRVNRDIGKESTFGLLYTDRELDTSPSTICTLNRCVVGSNRVGGFDTKLKFNSKWSATGQAVIGHTKFNDGTHKGGQSYWAYLERSSTKLEYNSQYDDTSAGFETDTGFFRRPDIRRLSNFALYRFRREGKILQWHGPSISTINNWDHHGTRLEYFSNANYRWIFQRQSDFGFYGNLGHERLRPYDYGALLTNRDYAHYHTGLFFDFGYFKQVSLGGEINLGTETNYNPAVGPPVLAKSNFAQIYATVRPVTRLSIQNTYLLTRLRDNITGLADLNNHIIRSKWNYQFNREFSLRLIGQYNAVLTNPALSSLQKTKQVNADILFTYLLHPGTAIYVGYNSDLQNIDPSLQVDPNDPNNNLLRSPYRLINDGRQLFVKISYLFRY
jgi:hypothetical protein